MQDFNSNLLPDLDLAEVTEKEFSLWTYKNSDQDYLTILLNTCSYEGRIRDRIERDIENLNMEEGEYYLLVAKLLDAQVDRITAGFNYSQTDILNHLRKL